MRVTTSIDRIKALCKCINNVYYLEGLDQRFEVIYMKVREAEGRIYSDSELISLPDITSSHRYCKEWRIRKRSVKMLSSYLGSKPKDKTVLELGCGNGWLSNKLAGIGFNEVIGMDVNITELEQAARVFSGKDNLIFVYGDIFRLPQGRDVAAEDSEAGLSFDYIFLSSVIAYFKNLPTLIGVLLNILKYNGEIHIIDSPFYEDTTAARERTIKYYSELGFPEMAEHYHHYSLDDLEGFNFSILHDPRKPGNRIKRKFSPTQPPFHWIKITK